MKSEFNLKTPNNLKITFVIGICATILIVALSLIFRFEFGLILLSVAGLFGLIGVSKALINFRQFRHLGKANNYELAKQQQELRLITYQADKAQLEAYTITFPNTHRIVMKPNSDIQLIEGVVKQLPATVVTNDNLPDLMDTIKNETSLISTGPKRSGKTTVAFHWLAGRGQCIVCDPKNETVEVNQWPSNCIVIGSDFKSIIKRFIKEMHRRRKAGLINEFPITLFFDESAYLIEDLDIDVVKIALRIATLGAEFQVFSGFTAHAITADYLKVKAAKLLENFVVVRSSKIGNTHRCFVNLGEGEFPVKHPGRYRQQVIVNRDDQIKQKITRLLQTTDYTPYEICRQVWGNGTKSAQNGDRYALIEQVKNSLR